MHLFRRGLGLALALTGAGAGIAGYTNFESSHAHPIALTPSGQRLLVVNTPDALLEVFEVQPSGALVPEAAIPVGLEPVTVVARTDSEAWVVNHLSDSVSIVDLDAGIVTGTLHVGDEPTAVVFAGPRAFVALSQLDRVAVYTVANLSNPPIEVSLSGRDIRSLAVSVDGSKVYAVPLRSGNRTSVVNSRVIFFGNSTNLDPARLGALNLTDIHCTPGAPPPYPDLPAGVARNPALTDPPPSANPADFPPTGLIVQWDETTSRWLDGDGQDWTDCLHHRPADDDLFVIDAGSLAVSTVRGLGTSLFDVSVQPGTGRIYVPHTEARNMARFELSGGVRGHPVDNRMAVVDPASGNAVTWIDLNGHIDRGSDPATNLGERVASLSQPGMLVWTSDGSAGYLSAIGSRKVFRIDGTCLAAGCIFGADRANPAAVDVGEGPTGIALHEGHDRLYVVNRISHSVAVVEASTLTLLEQVPLHDPSSEATRVGRRFLYDAIDTSGHGDASCASCHLSGDMDGLAWDLGDPTGGMVPYSANLDNVRFVVPQGGAPVECPPEVCADHEGFDPQKGPMVTQTLRAMLEPLHWRGDRATMNDFNQAFVTLMGTADIGPVNGKPAGLTPVDMERFRQFALEIRFPPNPYRNLDDTTPCGPRASDPGCEVQVHGGLRPGNPTEGSLLFDTLASDAGQPCVGCHARPFGTAGGQLGGVAPTEPTSAAATALFFGAADQSFHNDLEIPHLRNMYEKFGPVWADPGGQPPLTKTGFGFTHDGSVPDLLRFLSLNVFSLDAQRVRDIASFTMHFPTGTRPAVGRQVTIPAGTAPTGTAEQEATLTELLGLGDRSDTDRHCELVASTMHSGRLRRFHLDAGGWVGDLAAEMPLTMTSLREIATAPISFLCTPIDSGPRLGGNRDEDVLLDGDDCAVDDAQTWAAPTPVENLTVSPAAGATLGWDDQFGATGGSLLHDVIGGTLSDLSGLGIEGASACLATVIDGTTWIDGRPDPPADAGFYYLVRATNSCAAGTLGSGREGVDALPCD